MLLILSSIAAILLYVNADNFYELPHSEDVLTASIGYNLDQDIRKEPHPNQLMKSGDELSINARSDDGPFTNLGKKTIVGVYANLYNVLNDEENMTLWENCLQLKNDGYNISGSYIVMPRTAAKPFIVLCDMESRGGGWTYIQNRYDGSQDFYLTYRDYKFGFGDLDGEFWLGLLNIRSLIGDNSSLLVEMTDNETVNAYAHYKQFKIAPEANGFRLTAAGYNGTAGDSLSQHNGERFATYDYDNNGCAKACKGGWWYTKCFTSNPNGKVINGEYVDEYKSYLENLAWNSFRKLRSLAKFRMLIRSNN